MGGVETGSSVGGDVTVACALVLVGVEGVAADLVDGGGSVLTGGDVAVVVAGAGAGAVVVGAVVVVVVGVVAGAGAVAGAVVGTGAVTGIAAIGFVALMGGMGGELGARIGLAGEFGTKIGTIGLMEAVAAEEANIAVLIELTGF